MSNSLWPHGLQHASILCPLSPGVCKFMSIESVMPPNHQILCCPLLLLPSIFPRIRVFSNESVFMSGGQSIGASTSASVFPMNTQGCQYASKSGKLSSGHRTGKSQFSFQSQRQAMPKNVQTTIQLHSFHMLTRLCSRSFKLGFSSMWTKNFEMYKEI